MTAQSFRFRHEPQSEQEVVCLFMALLPHLDEFEKPLVIEQVRSAFPDCTISAAGRRLRIEFELYGSRFDHPYDGCDWVVCWRDDRGGWPASVRVLELAGAVTSKRPGLIVSVNESYPTPWNEETFFAAAEREGTDARDVALMRRAIELARHHGLGPIWLANPKPRFAVGYGRQFFRIRATGSLRFPFVRLGAGDAFPALVDRLNSVVPKLRLRTADVTTKGKGDQLSSLFENDQQMQDFFNVWAWFRSAQRGPSHE